MKNSNRLFFVLNALVSTSALVFLFWLIYVRQSQGSLSPLILALPGINACMNASSATALLIGRWRIAKDDIRGHKFFMLIALSFSIIFLIGYIFYHQSHGDTKFLGTGWVRPVYFSLLISHILLSMAVLPLVFTTVYFAIRGQFEIHRRWARVTFPIWLYVSVTGVVIYFFLRSFS